VASVGGKEFPAVESLTARQVQEYFPEAAGAVEMHEAVCGWEEGGSGPVYIHLLPRNDEDGQCPSPEGEWTHA
jgi:hypothetical protein